MAMICGKCKTQFDITTGIPKDETCPCCRGKLELTEIRGEGPLGIIKNKEWDWRKGYRRGVDDPISEIRYDMMKLEQKATETGSLKKYREMKMALKNFEEAHQDLLK